MNLFLLRVDVLSLPEVQGGDLTVHEGQGVHLNPFMEQGVQNK